MRSPRWLIAGALSLAVVAPLLPLLLPLSGGARGGWGLFLGRFHPLLVHFPVALVPMAWGFELLTRRRARSLAVVVPALLYAAALSALIAFALGLLLARGEGTTGLIVSRHYLAASSVVSTMLVAAALYGMAGCAAEGRLGRWCLTGSRAALSVGLLLTIWTGHLGAQLTHGEAYLTEHAPWRQEKTAEAAVEPTSRAFDALVQPIFRTHCTTCHGSSRVEGDLRLDSFAALSKGGEHGAVIRPGDANGSELIRRVTLPRDHEDAMPAQGRPALDDEEVAVLRWWIDTGASETLTLAAVKDPPEEIATLLERTISRASAAPLPLEDAARLARHTGLDIVPVSSAPADGFRVTAFNLAGGVDAALAKLEPIATLVTEVDLSHSDASDQAVVSLAGWTNLRTLNLAFTKIRGKGLGQLRALTKLHTLNIAGTSLTSDAPLQLARLTPLQRLILSDTPLADEDIRRVASALPSCTVVAGPERVTQS
jgi:mono/diheme cytochrome c family protein